MHENKNGSDFWEVHYAVLMCMRRRVLVMSFDICKYFNLAPWVGRLFGLVLWD